MKDNKNFIWIFTFILISIEQGIKLIINNKYLDVNFSILEPLLYFEPKFNRDYSWFNSMLKLGVGKGIHILIVLILILLTFLFYKFINRKKETTRLIDTTFAFLFSGAICSLIDKVFWNGSLDYILFYDLFIFDLKDLYVNVFIGLVILMIIIDYKGLRTVDDKDLLKDFIKFLKRK